jgi:hypothetical protein
VRCGRWRSRGSISRAGRYDEDSTRGYAEDDEARLFGEVLPALRDLERVTFDSCFSCETNVALFASKLSAATSPLVELELRHCFGDFSNCVAALADMIRRNGPLQVLKLNMGHRMDKDECRQIFGGLQHNSNLRRLEVRVEEVYDDVPIFSHRGPNSASSLRQLCMEIGEWTVEGKSSLARQLRTDAALEELHIRHGAPHSALEHRPWVEMLESHNFTLLGLRERSLFSGADPRDGPVLRSCGGTGGSARRSGSCTTIACLRRSLCLACWSWWAPSPPSCTGSFDGAT